VTSLAFLFINSPREYLFAFMAITVTCSLLFVLLCVVAYKWTTRNGRRYPVQEPPRIQLPREPHIDLAAARNEHELRREAREENELLRRAG
jgi:hypothetical protein